jgi:hypothetical protein
MSWVGHVARMGDKKNAYNILVRDLEGREAIWGIHSWVGR